MFNVKYMNLTLGDVLDDSAEGKNFPVNESRECKVCQEDARYFISLDFTHHATKVPVKSYGVSVHHYKCDSCGHIFTNFCDDWSDDEFSRFMYNEYYIEVDPDFGGIRSKYFADFINRKSSDDFRSVSVLDYGSGQGHLENYLKDYGFKDVVSWDPYSKTEVPDRKFDIVFGLEVLEHSPRPHEFFDSILSFLNERGVCYCSQLFVPDDIENIRDRWYYFAPRNGHVSFFAHETIKEIANRKNLQFKICDDGFFIWKGDISSAVQSFVDKFDSVYGNIVLQGAPLLEKVQGWHGLETYPAGKFRWTATTSCPLGVLNLKAYKNTISLHVLLAQSEGHFVGASLRIGDMHVPLRPDGNHLVGEFVAKSLGKHFVTLQTAPPISPKKMGVNNDERDLGLAICAIESTPDWCL